MTVDGQVVQTVQIFFYLGEMIGSEAGNDRSAELRPHGKNGEKYRAC